MITDSQIQEVLDWLVREAKNAAQARAHRVFLEEHRHTVKALAMKESKETSAAAQERDAYCSQSYKDHLEALKQAVFEDEKYRVYYKAAECKLDCWRSFCANARIQGKIG